MRKTLESIAETNQPGVPRRSPMNHACPRLRKAPLQVAIRFRVPDNGGSRRGEGGVRKREIQERGMGEDEAVFHPFP